MPVKAQRSGRDRNSERGQTNVPSPTRLDTGLFDAGRVLGRAQRLAVNLAGAGPSITIGGGLTIGLGAAGDIVQLVLGVNGRIPLTSGDVVVSLETDTRWIQGQPPAGISVGVLDRSTMTFTPSLAANGVGVRVSRDSGPLLNVGVALGSVTAYWFLQSVPQSDHPAFINALHHAFQVLGAITIASSVSFSGLRAEDGANVSQHRQKPRIEEYGEKSA